jgi:uncharacterized protein (TIGR02246 family)
MASRRVSALAQQHEVDFAMSSHPIQSVGIRFVETWNAHDMVAFGQLFREDADFVNVFGGWYRGRARIRAEHVAIHAGVFRESRLSADEMHVKALSDTVASLHLRWSLVGIVAPNGAASPERKGILTLILTKTSDKWEIAVAQNTDIVPRPAV